MKHFLFTLALLFCFPFILLSQTITNGLRSDIDSLFLPAERFIEQLDTLNAIKTIESAESTYLRKHRSNPKKLIDWYTQKASFYAYRLCDMSSAYDLQFEASKIAQDNRNRFESCYSLLSLTSYALLDGDYTCAYASSVAATVLAELHKENERFISRAYENYIKTCLLIGRNKEAQSAAIYLKNKTQQKIFAKGRQKVNSSDFFEYEGSVDLLIQCDIALGYIDETAHEFMLLDSLANEVNTRAKYPWEKKDIHKYCILGRIKYLLSTKQYGEAIAFAHLRPQYLKLPWNLLDMLDEVQIHLMLAETFLQLHEYSKTESELNLAFENLTNCNVSHPLLSKIFSIEAKVKHLQGGNREAIQMLSYAKNQLHQCGIRHSVVEGDILQQLLTYAQCEKSTERYWNKWILQATRLKYHNLKEEFAISDSNERFHIWSKNSYKHWFEDILPAFLIDHPHLHDNDTLLNCAYGGVQTAKGILLHSDIRIRNLVMQSQDKALISNYKTYTNLRNDLLNVEENHNYKRLDSLQKAIYQLDNDIMRALNLLDDSEFQNSLKIKNNYLSKITKGDVYIDFIRYNNFNNVSCYGAFLAFTYNGRPVVVPLYLCDAEQIEKLSIDSMFSDSRLYNLLWKKIEVGLNNLHATNIYFSAAGQLHNLPIEYALDEKKRLFNDKFNVYRVLSTRDALIKKNFTRQRNYKEVSLWGNMNYYGYKNELSFLHPQQLPYSRKEINTIKREGVGKINCQLFELNQATEKKFKTQDFRQTDIIHIASHGFYFNEHYRKKHFKGIKSTDHYAAGSRKGMLSFEDKSLMHSALLFSRANEKNHQDDGLLTAAEVSAMDLSHVDLSVLSACQSGLGDSSSEGNLGLQRAFKKAGVNSQLISLKNVYDQSTYLLMKEFYQELFNGHTKAESLRKAQKSLKNKYNGQFKDPKYWAPFILIDAFD